VKNCGFVGPPRADGSGKGLEQGKEALNWKLEKAAACLRGRRQQLDGGGSA